MEKNRLDIGLRPAQFGFQVGDVFVELIDSVPVGPQGFVLEFHLEGPELVAPGEVFRIRGEAPVALRPGLAFGEAQGFLIRQVFLGPGRLPTQPGEGQVPFLPVEDRGGEGPGFETQGRRGVRANRAKIFQAFAPGGLGEGTGSGGCGGRFGSRGCGRLPSRAARGLQALAMLLPELFELFAGGLQNRLEPEVAAG